MMKKPITILSKHNKHNIYSQFKAQILKHLDITAEEGKKVFVEPPREQEFGDLTTNAAMVLSKLRKQTPQNLAENLAQFLKTLPYVENVEVAQPPFVNWTMTRTFWTQIVTHILEYKENYARNDVGSKEKVVVEYVSANPTGPLHTAHVRGAVVGDVVANLLAFFNFDVQREYYVNDAGKQIEDLALSVYWRYRQLVQQSSDTFPQNLYAGEYVIDIAKHVHSTHGNTLLNSDKNTYLPIISQIALDSILTSIKTDLHKLGVYHDRFISEKEFIQSGKVDEAINQLRKASLVYEGVLEESRYVDKLSTNTGKSTLIFASSKFGDDNDRALKKHDGSWTYFATDIAYHYDKYLRSDGTLVNVLGADHDGYAKRITSSLQALSEQQATLYVIWCQMVTLIQNGKEIRMSKREANFHTLAEMLQHSDPDAIRFFMLLRKNDMPLEFDLSLVSQQNLDNPIFYVQYAHARTHSCETQAHLLFPNLNVSYENVNADKLLHYLHDDDLPLIKNLTKWPLILETCLKTYEVHRIVFFLQNVSSSFHQLWNKGRINKNLRFVQEDCQERTRHRLMLCLATRYVISSALYILGINAKKSL